MAKVSLLSFNPIIFYAFSLIATSNFGDHETDTPIHYEIFTQSRQARKELPRLYFASLAPLREP